MTSSLRGRDTRNADFILETCVIYLAIIFESKSRMRTYLSEQPWLLSEDKRKVYRVGREEKADFRTLWKAPGKPPEGTYLKVSVRMNGVTDSKMLDRVH